jgi:hypothetical protein
LQQFGGQRLWGEGGILCHAAVCGYAVQVAVGKQALCQGREADETYAMLMAELEFPVLYGRAVEHVESCLIDEEGGVVLVKMALTVGISWRMKLELTEQLMAELKMVLPRQ